MRNNCFTFLRYAFALSIFGNHLYFTTEQGAFPFNVAICVCGFFAMSGFLTFNSYRNTPDPRAFAVRRVRRVYPAYALTILLCCLAGLFLTSLPLGTYLLHPDTWKYVGYNLLFLNFMQPTLPGVFESNASPLVNGALWTMKIEVLFYATVPLVHWLMKRWGTDKTLLSIIIPSLLYHYVTHIAYTLTGIPLLYTLHHQLPGVLCQFYIPVLMLCHADRVDAHLSTLLCASGLPVLFSLFVPSLLNWVLPVCVPILIVTFARRCRQWFTATPWPDFTYEFYLLHFPVLQVLLCTIPQARPLAIACMALTLTVLLAQGLHTLQKRC